MYSYFSCYTCTTLENKITVILNLNSCILHTTFIENEIIV